MNEIGEAGGGLPSLPLSRVTNPIAIAAEEEVKEARKGGSNVGGEMNASCSL